MVKDNGYLLKSFLIIFVVLGGIISLIIQFFPTVEIASAQTEKVASFSATVADDFIPQATSSAQIAPEKLNNFSVRVPVLMYHYIRNNLAITDELSFKLSVSPQNLEQQLSYLAENGYLTLSLGDLYESLETQTPLPPKSVVLTFDDGFRDFYTTAFPLLKKYNLRAVNFYVAGYAGYPGYMNWDMVREMHRSGLVDIQSHTLSHLPLTKLAPEIRHKEIVESKAILEANLNKKVNYFAYPYGEYDETVIQLTAAAGYRLAFSTRPGGLQLPSEKYFLKRTSINGQDDLEVFKYKLEKF